MRRRQKPAQLKDRREKTRAFKMTSERWGSERGEDFACDRKGRYSDELGARCAAQHTLAMPYATVERLWVYRCPACRGFHMTKRNNGTPSVTAQNAYDETTYYGYDPAFDSFKWAAA